MSERPYVSFAEVKEKVPIPDALDSLGIAAQFTRKGDTLTGVCPLPNHQHGPSPNSEQFKVNRKDGVWLWHCFGDCQCGGDVVELVKAMTGYDDAHVRFWFAEKFGDRLNLKKPKKAEKEAETKEACEDHQQNDQSQTPANTPTDNLSDDRPALKPLRFFLNLDSDVPYLQQRGLSPETIARYGLGLCHRGYLKGYIAIPVYAYPRLDRGNPVAYLGRWPGEEFDQDAGRPRYKWPDGFPKSQVLYGLNEALEEPEAGFLIVVEGPFKLFHLVQAGFPNTVAVFGSSLSDEQARLLVNTGLPIVLLFDGNEAGYAGMRTAAAKLIKHTFVRVIKLPDGTEPDDLSSDELAGLLP